MFFTLLSVLFLSVFFALIESARFQGARAQAAHITDLAHYGTFGEYEQMLLASFELFGVDGAYGSGDFSIQRVRDRLLHFADLNAVPNQDPIASLMFDPWQIRIQDCKTTEYALLSDRDGEYFYQQAVAYMRETQVTQAAGKLLGIWRDALDAEEKKEQFEREKLTADQQLEELQDREDALTDSEDAPDDPGQLPENPIPALKRLARKSLLEITCGDSDISDAKIARSEQVYSRRRNSGNMQLPTKHRGLLNDMYFREYLLDHFGDFRSQRAHTRLHYELEYILGGKRSDQANLKTVIGELLLLREGSNYLFCASDETMSTQAGTLAALLAGWTGIPALTAILKHALLVGWAYAESLLDVRTILSGGKVPLLVTKEDWVLSLDQLAQINELLQEDRSGRQDGLGYHDYLRLLLSLQSVAAQKRRGLELVELRIRQGSGLSNFQVDNAVIALKDQITYHIPAVFSRIPSVFMRAANISGDVVVPGGFSYL